MPDKGEIEFENGSTKFMGTDQDLTVEYFKGVIKGVKPILQCVNRSSPSKNEINTLLNSLDPFT